MAAPLYGVAAGADVQITTTPKTVLSVRAGASFALLLKQLSVTLDSNGASAPTNEPILVELCYCTFGGTGTSTSETPVQLAGRVTAHGTTCASNYTAEPTTLSVLDEFLIHPQGGMRETYALGDEFDTALNEGFALRITAPNTTNCRPMMRFSRG